MPESAPREIVEPVPARVRCPCGGTVRQPRKTATARCPLCRLRQSWPAWVDLGSPVAAVDRAEIRQGVG